MRKSTLFISTVLTAFMLAVIFGVVKAYQQISASNAVASKPESVAMAPTATAQPTMEASSIPTMPAVISPEQATTIATEFLGDNNVYSVEVVDYQGVPAFLVTFSSGQLIYVSPKGEIIGISKLEPVVVSIPPQRNNNGGSSNNTVSGGDDHDEHDEHEEHDD